MRVYVTLDDELLAEAKRLTEIDNTQQLLRRAVAKMAHYEALKYLVSLAGTMPDLKLTPRRRLLVGDEAAEDIELEEDS